MEMRRSDVAMIVAAAVILAVGFAAAGFLTGRGFYMSRMADRFVTVKGLAERDVSADLAVWNMKITSTGDDLSSVQDRIDRDRDTLMAFLKAQGINEDEISLGRFSVTDLMAQEYRSERAETSRFILRYSVTVGSLDVAKIQKASGQIGELIRKGLVLADNAGPNYFFTKLNEIKPALIQEATKNARRAAEQFAADSGSRVGSIRRASQGVISIGARDGASQDPEEEMYSNTGQKQIEKKVRVVSTINYFLEG